jgi:glycosyltransferase involved in cell wall biosynthesis
MKVAWVTSWNRICGIADYSKELWPEVKSKLEALGHTGILVSIDETGIRKGLLQKLISLQPDIIHFQHEYGLYGGKNPPLYSFSSLIKNLRVKLPRAKLIATAHTVLPQGFRYPTRTPNWQWPLRILANFKLLPYLSNQWREKTWGPLHGVIVHSVHQIESIVSSGLNNVKAIPHFVKEQNRTEQPKKSAGVKLLVFGFFSEDKGQDIVIESLSILKDKNVKLILAGGVRRIADQKFYDFCKIKINKLGLENQIVITGFVQAIDLQKVYADITLVIAPFRSTSGSGSLTQSLGRGLPVLASDLILNQEISQRVSGALELFKTENSHDLAQKIEDLISDPGKLNSLREKALEYTKRHSPTQIAALTVDFYEKTKNLPSGII